MTRICNKGSRQRAFVLGAALLGLCAHFSAALANLPPPGVILAWDPAQDTNVVGYFILYGTVSGSYTSSTNVGNVTTAIISGLASGPTYYFVTTSYDAEGDVSLPSNEVSFNSAGNGPPVITTQPAGQNANAGTTATFVVVAGAAGSLTYQWMENGTNALSDGGKISGSGTASLTISNVLGGDAGQCSVIVSNAAGPAASSSALLTVVDPCYHQPTGEHGAKAGLTAQFSVRVAGTPPSLSVAEERGPDQWRQQRRLEFGRHFQCRCGRIQRCGQ